MAYRLSLLLFGLILVSFSVRAQYRLSVHFPDLPCLYRDSVGWNGDCSFSRVKLYFFSPKVYGDFGVGYSLLQIKPACEKDLKKFAIVSSHSLNRREVDTLSSILKQPQDWENDRANLCAFVPHHAIVFFDRFGNIRAWIDICFTCRDAIVAPYSGVSLDDQVMHDLYVFFDQCGLLPDGWKWM